MSEWSNMSTLILLFSELAL